MTDSLSGFNEQIYYGKVNRKVDKILAGSIGFYISAVLMYFIALLAGPSRAVYIVT